MSSEFYEVMRVLKTELTHPAVTDVRTPAAQDNSGLVQSRTPQPSTALARAHEIRPEQKATVIACVEAALDLMGRTGKDVFFEILWRRYAVSRDDIIESPGRFMTVLKVFLDTSSGVVERYLLDELERRLKINAPSLEEAIAILKEQE